MKFSTDTYTAITPFGIVEVDFPEDGGVVFDGAISAVEHLKAVIDECTGTNGISLTPQNLEPYDFYHFCQPKGSMVTILEPWDDLLSGRSPYRNNDDDEGDGYAVMDDASGMGMNLASAGNMSLLDMRRDLKMAPTVREKLTIMRAMLSHLNDTGALAAQDEAQQPRNPSGRFYEFNPNRKRSQRVKDNEAAMALLARIDAGGMTAADLTDDEKTTLAKYSGTGGALIGADGKKGSAYEYYTPKPIAEGMWNLLGELGFSGGRVLDPCGGVGIFGATAPLTSVVDAVELNETSGKVNGLVNGGPGYSCTVAPFEKVAAATPDEMYDAVVSNVPFGEVADRGGNQLLDKRYQKEPIQNYFILRSLEKLKPGGLAAFITPPRCVSGRGGAEASLRVRASYMAEFLGAYRLPNSVFGTAQADTMTDVIVFRKFSRDVLEKIEELREQSPQTLVDSNVQWPEFTEGQYFNGEGKRFVLGTFVPKDPEKFRDVDRVVTGAGVGEIGKMLRKFGGTRIKWDLLNAVETTPIVYRDGDTIAQAGTTLQMRDGRWVPLDTGLEDAQTEEMMGKVTRPYTAFEEGVTVDQALSLHEVLGKTDRLMDVYPWFLATVAAVKKADEASRATLWSAAVVGQAVVQVLNERLGEEVGVKYVEEYAALSEAMQRMASAAKKATSSTNGVVKEGLATLTRHYSKKTGFSAVWRGDVLTEVKAVESTSDNSFEGLRYRSKSIWVDMEDARAIYGESWNPLEDADWCISGDGRRVTKAADYYVGNYADFLRRIDAEIETATSERVRAKLVRQKLDAEKNAGKLDPSQMQFNLFSPLVTEEEKAEFLRRFVHPSADVFFDEKTSKKYVDIDVKGSNLSDREKLIKRVGDYMRKGTITLGGTKLSSMSDAEGLRELRKMIETANEQFNAWSRGNREVMNRIHETVNDPERMRFKPVDDEAEIKIQGMRIPPKLHGYQASFVRQMSRDFSGINGFGVGLGKTLTALAVAQHAHNIGAKRKTVFVVPNSVLSNWRKEATRAYDTMDDCLFVGLRIGKSGDATVKSSEYDADLTTMMENRHSKVFMTMEAFERLRMRDDTISGYENYLRSVDSTFSESEDKKKDEQNKGKAKSLLEVLGGKSGAAPYIEDLGIDSIIIDEGHVFKNSSEVFNFKGAKYLSLSGAAKRGIDAQAKAWYIRGQSAQKDGVLMLTATPITNSPLEIYSMLTLAVGHDRVNDMCAGIQGADAFMDMVCVKKNEDDVTMDGVARTTDVFTGLQNVNVLRHAIGSAATIKNAADVGNQIIVPERDEEHTPIALPEDVKARLQLYKMAFRYAMDEISEKVPNRGDPDAYETVRAHFGEEMELIGHPFNLINKMTMLIADPELDQRGTFYSFPPDQAALADKVVAEFNKKRYTEDRTRMMPLTAEDAVVGTKVKKNSETGDTSTTYKIAVRAIVDRDKSRFAIDTMDHATQQAFEAMAEKMGLDLDVTIPPKLAALLENVKKEQATPRGINDEGKNSPIVKQIVFCDILPMHSKIKRLLAKHAGIPAGKIAIITGQVNNEPDAILDVQDGFNADGEDNKFNIIIANEKAEVGINLQKGTQAIHHLTIGWTPDSLEQRNGRGVRQGNKTQKVTIYHYDASGTFDTSKRTMVNKKADWIESVMSSAGGNSVAVAGGLSREQQEALIEVVGDEAAMRTLEAKLATQEAQARAQANRERQMMNLDTINKQKAFLEANKDPKRMVASKVAAYRNLRAKANQLRDRINNPKATESAVIKNRATLYDVEARMSGLARDIEASASLVKKSTTYQYGEVKEKSEPTTLVSIITQFETNAKRGDSGDDALIDELTGARWSRSGNSLELKETGPIQEEWQAEMDMANAMIEGAIEAYEAQAQEAGGMPEKFARMLVAGTAIMVDGAPVMNGAMSRYNDSVALAVIDLPNGVKKVVSMQVDGRNAYMGFDNMVNPGTAEHLAMMQYAAKLEDDLAAAGQSVKTFSELVPEIAAMRVTRTPAQYRTDKYTLPHPYFPFVATEYQARSSLVWGRIAEQQAAIVKSRDHSTFTVDPDVAVVEHKGDYAADRDKAIVAYALANGIKMEAGFDIKANEIKEMVARIDIGEFKAALPGSSKAEVERNAAKFIESKLTQIIEFTNLSASSPDIMPVEFLDAIIEARRAATGSSGDNPKEIVGITGNTKKWMGEIKYAANTHGDGKCRWHKGTLTWNVYRSAWDALTNNNPAAEKELRLVRSKFYTL